MGDNETTYVADAFKTNWIAPLGPNVLAFEDSIERFYEENVFAAALSSGTAALHLGLQLLGVAKGDEVICQSLTFSASANPIKYLGATPVFVDSETETWNICPELTRKAIHMGIERGKKPKAIVAVHLYGMPFLYEELKSISDEFNIPILEDSAEALGSIYNNRKCGELGDIGILSFNGNKIITTSGGGALLAANKEIRDRAVFLATQARDNAPHYEHSHIGYNYRMSNVLAGIGMGQMEVIQDRVDARRANFEFYQAKLKHITEIKFLEEPQGFYCNRWLTTITTPSYDFREKLRISLMDENIESRPIWKPMHLQPIFKDCPKFVNGSSEMIFTKGLCLPSGSNLTKNDKERVVDTILNVL
jgi:dTDP-4-amino-4,6-dideoxygalactose transaminase